MKRVKILLKITSLTLGIAILATQSANAVEVHSQVCASAERAAKFALSKNWEGAQATCYIAAQARETANLLTKNLGPKATATPEYRAMIASATHHAAKDLKIEGLLEDKVHIDCQYGVTLPIVAGSVISLASIAAISGDSNELRSSRAPITAE